MHLWITCPQYPHTSEKTLNKCSWDSFKEVVSHTNVPELQGRPTKETRYNGINIARQTHIPTQRTEPHRNKSKITLFDLSLHNTTFTTSHRHGWDQEPRTRYRQIQKQLHGANKQQHTGIWTRLTNEFCQNHKDPKQFWASYKKLMGTNRQQCTYIYNEQNKKIDDIQGMEAIHRRLWQRNFQIPDSENSDVDTENI